ncbi:MAG: ABC transporter ATP-binding protein [Parcubacteria group bacterium]|nr:ABC transporter ATP-binding protein [Parcubacteria group bacterium]
MIKNNPLIYLTKKVWQYSVGNRKNLILYLLMFVMANVISLMTPLIFAKIMNVVQEIITKKQLIDSNDLLTLFFLMLLLPIIQLLFWVFHGPARVMERKNAFIAEANYKKFLLAGTMAFPMEWHVEHHTGDTSDKIERGSSSLFYFSENTFGFIQMIIQLIGSYIALIYFHPPSAYLILFVILFAGYVVVKYDKILVPQYEYLNKAGNKISEKVIDAITNISTIIILRVEKHVQKAIAKKIVEPFSVYKSECKTTEIKWFLVSLFSSISTVLVLFSYFYGNYRAHTMIMIGTIFALYSYISNIQSLFHEFAWRYSDMVRQKAKISNAEEIANDFQAYQKTQSMTLNDNWNKLEIKSLSFSYNGEEGADLHLDDISLGIKKGERIALIGSTGSGKSTLLKIIRELYHPSSLNLYLDGKFLKNGFKSISSEVALIPQDPEIFQETIMDNITVGADYNMAEILKYTDMACFTDVAMNLPKKFNSMIKERGVNLSGGEKQRLALARGLLASRDKAIVLLDEPTSSVDVVTEEKIFKNIFGTFADKAIICSLHGLHLLPLFDKIHYFDNGKIIAEGKFDELLESSDEFRKIWEDFVSNRDKKN